MFDNDPLDDFFGGGGPAALKFAAQNVWMTGTIYQVDIKNQIDMVTQLPKLDERTGQPKQMCVLYLATDLRDELVPDDDGSRRQFLTGNMLFEFRAALRALNVRKPQIGARVATAWTGTKPSKFPQPQKLYTVRYMEPTAESLAVAQSRLNAAARTVPAGDPFGAAPAGSVPVSQQRTTLDSMRSSDPFGDEPPF